MKTPEEIKKGIKCCNTTNSCNVCPYYGEDECLCNKNDDAFSLIQQLEQERDALIAALKKTDVDCEYCKHVMQNSPHCDAADCNCERCPEKENCKCCTCSRLNNNWEWCGVKHE